MSTAGFKHIRTDKRGTVMVITFREGRLLDEAVIRDIGKELMTLAEDDEPKLVLQFNNVRYLASAMLGKLITLQRNVQKRNGALGFCEIPPDAMEVFKISKLDNYFQVYETLDKAVAAVA